MKIEHRLFAHYFMITGDKYFAYSKAYPKASGEPLKRAARRLINQPHIREFVIEEMWRIEQLLEQQKMQPPTTQEPDKMLTADTSGGMT